jgi:hypothetical protein
MTSKMVNGLKALAVSTALALTSQAGAASAEEDRDGRTSGARIDRTQLAEALEFHRAQNRSWDRERNPSLRYQYRYKWRSPRADDGTELVAPPEAGDDPGPGAEPESTKRLEPRPDPRAVPGLRRAAEWLI